MGNASSVVIEHPSNIYMFTTTLRLLHYHTHPSNTPNKEFRYPSNADLYNAYKDLMDTYSHISNLTCHVGTKYGYFRMYFSRDNYNQVINKLRRNQGRNGYKLVHKQRIIYQYFRY